jgi:hypothetical protein
MNDTVGDVEQGRLNAPKSSEARAILGKVSVELDYTRQAIGELLETWRDLNPEIFDESEGEV